MRSILAIAATLSGRQLIAKLALFMGMLALAAHNRFRLAPKFATAMIALDRAIALATIPRTIMIDALCAIAVQGLVGWLERPNRRLGDERSFPPLQANPRNKATKREPGT